MLDYLLTLTKELVGAYDVVGILVGMIIASSILPVPSEAILVYAGVVGISSLKVAIFGGIGSSLGAVVGYKLGRGGRVFIKRYGRYLSINPTSGEFVEDWFKKWGNCATLFGRIIPFIPYKVFSIGAGFGKMEFKNFFIFTLIGSIPRCFLLSSFGYLVSLTRNPFLMAASISIFFLLPVLVERLLKRK